MSKVTYLISLVILLAAWQYYKHNFPMTKEAPQAFGYCHEGFSKVLDTLKSNLESGLERGASFAVYYKGEVLVDIWGGWADQDIERHWQSNTLSLTWSVTKGVSAIVIAKLVDMGLLDYKKEVYRYWPEFAVNGKGNITVEMLMAHQAGLIGLDEPIKLVEYRDNWTKVERLLAQQKPMWPAGTAQGYHALTFGMYADALVRRVDNQHRNLSQFFQEEIAKTLDIEFYIGLPLREFHRYARPVSASFWEQRFSYVHQYNLKWNPFFPISTSFVEFSEKEMSQPDNANVGLPSIAGYGSARSLAKLYDFLANKGSLKDKQLLSYEIVDTLLRPVNANMPNVFLTSCPISPGLMIYTNSKNQSLIGHSGLGGSIAFADPDNNVGVAYFTNYLGGYLIDDPREISLRNSFYECFKAYKGRSAPRQNV